MAFSTSSRQLPRPSIDSNVTAVADDVEDGETVSIHWPIINAPNADMHVDWKFGE